MPSSFDSAVISKQSGKDCSSITNEWYLVAIKFFSTPANIESPKCFISDVLPCIIFFACTILPPNALPIH